MKRFLTLLSLTILLFCTTTILSAPEKKLWDRWTVHKSTSTKTIKYDTWQKFLDRYVSTNHEGTNLVDYDGVTQEDKAKLKRTIATLAAIPIDKYNRQEQRAYWINLYNALTVSVVLDHYPVQSILKIDLDPSFFQNGPWSKKLISVEGTPVSLDDIEHRILRPIWNDPRLHYALNCASISCPNLMKTAYTGKNTDQLLDENAKNYVNSPRGALINGKDELIVSSIYMWYRSDFGKSDPAIIAHLRKYANPPLQKALEGRRKIDGHDYDWSLNEGKATSPSTSPKQTPPPTTTKPPADSEPQTHNAPPQT